MTADKAKVELQRVKFNRFYAEREAHRVGPSPEEKGRAEAEEILELDRQLSGLGNVER